MDGESLYDLIEESDFGDTKIVSGDDIFSILGPIENVPGFGPLPTPNDDNNEDVNNKLMSQKSSSSILSAFQESENDLEFAASPKSKRQKFSGNTSAASSDQEGNQDAEQNRVSHITVERNRRKQMNEHLTVLRSLMPCFYVKRGDQASIIGGVVDYINELQQLLQSLEAKKQRKSIYNEMLSPRVNVSSPRMASSSTLPLSPRKPPLSPRMSLPISPTTPSSPYKPKLPYSPTCSSSTNCSSTINHNTNDIKINENYIAMNELVANSKSAIADVEVKFTASSNVLLKTISPRIPGQATKIISALKDLSLEILQVNINTIDEKVLSSFTIKIGIECQLSAEELAHQIQQTFSRSIS
ncbi:DNA-binding transcription factor [Lithospermum erythrorhizon]|uniref:DNA-binding transcription factor n=1 Tax=Lithospermum erythrorhizon TaxID=34254 RepID=A0AAV3QNJ8_LITER